MRHINNYKIFENNSEKVQRIHSICRKYRISNYNINEDESIDVEGDVYLHGIGIESLPLKSNKVDGYFYCDNNILTSLEGSPRYANGFNCSYNKLTTLEGGPEYVDYVFGCNNNKLISLEGSPKRVGRFDCRCNKITSLEGCPKYVGRSFTCSNNKITSLEGYPEYVGGNFHCENNPIYSIVQYFIHKEDKNNLIELFNYYDIVQDMNIIYDRLKFFYEGIGIDIKMTGYMLKDIEENGYKIIY